MSRALFHLCICVGISCGGQVVVDPGAAAQGGNAGSGASAGGGAGHGAGGHAGAGNGGAGGLDFGYGGAAGCFFEATTPADAIPCDQVLTSGKPRLLNCDILTYTQFTLPGCVKDYDNQAVYFCCP